LKGQPNVDWIAALDETDVAARQETVAGGGIAKFRESLAPASGLNNTWRISWAQAQCSVDETGGMVSVRQNAQKPYGFLPWQENGATYLPIPGDVGAQLVLTGPLTGCTVWAFQADGKRAIGGSAAIWTVLVHANANASTGQPTPWTSMSELQKDNNMTAKKQMVDAIKARYSGAIDVARLVYANTPGVIGATTYEGYTGFVLGCKPRAGFSLNSVSWTGRTKASAAWTFYFYGYNKSGTVLRVLD
jgi:hypothetical protein